ncbi:MAG: HNH endonuclease [Burkholderiaceae bacterium]|nr:HNH endonuclease [Burkholderiaceae bacterium]
MPEEVLSVLERLEGLGLTVAPSGRANKTIRIQAGTTYLAYVNEFVLKRGGLVGYRFSAGKGKASNECPEDFELERFASERGIQSVAFDVQRDDGRLYLHIRDGDAACALLQNCARTDARTERRSRNDEILSDLKDISEQTDISETTRRALVEARLGQGAFRKSLLRIYGNRCAVTELNVVPLLRASHILPWRDSNNDQRLDPNNGLLLSPNLDALFDSYLITFSRDGEIRFSSLLDSTARKLLGPTGNLLVAPSPKQAEYLHRHGLRVR